MIKKYCKKPVVIEAIEWTGNNTSEIMDFCSPWSAIRRPRSATSGSTSVEHYLTIETLEGYHGASVGDMIIKGVKGEVYPCKPDIFKLTYKEITNND